MLSEVCMMLGLVLLFVHPEWCMMLVILLSVGWSTFKLFEATLRVGLYICVSGSTQFARCSTTIRIFCPRRFKRKHQEREGNNTIVIEDLFGEQAAVGASHTI